MFSRLKSLKYSFFFLKMLKFGARLEFHALIFISVLQLATCVAVEANPAVNITWLKDNKPLLADGDGASFLFLVV